MAVLVGFHCGVIRCELANQACGMARPKQALEAEFSVCGNPVGRPDLNPRSRAVFSGIVLVESVHIVAS